MSPWFIYIWLGTVFLVYLIFAPSIRARACRGMNTESVKKIFREAIDTNLPGKYDLNEDLEPPTLVSYFISRFVMMLAWPLFLGVEITFYWKVRKGRG